MTPSLTPSETSQTRRLPSWRLPSWRLAALAAASMLVLAACGAGASGAASTAPSTTLAQTAPSSPAVPSPPAATATVGILNFKFTPATLTVKVGTTVTWTNMDAIAHTVNFATGDVNSSTLNQNDHFTHTFTAAGTYDYICSIHPFMHGSVTVTA